MPTTTEVEARLRRTAEACEPIVDAVLAESGDIPDGGELALAPRRVGWLAAAAVLVVLALGAAVMTTRGGDRPEEVRATTPEPTDSTVPDAPTGPAYTVPLALPDGTNAFLQVPGDDRWRQAEQLVQGTTASGVELTIVVVAHGTTLGDFPVRQHLMVDRPDGHAVVRFRGLDHIEVVSLGWTGLIPLPGLADDEADRIADLVRSTLLSVGPVFESSPELRVDRVGAHVVALSGADSSFAAWRDVPDGELTVGARGTPALDLVTGTTAVLGGGEPVVQHVPLAFADGTRLIVSLPGSSAYRPGAGTAELAIDGERLTNPVVAIEEMTAEAFAAARGATLTPLSEAPAGADPVWATWRVDEGSERSWLLLGTAWGMPWVAALPIRAGGDLVPTDLVDRLADDLGLRPTADGPVDLDGPGITVTQATRTIEAQPSSWTGGIEVRVGPGAEQACRAGVDRAEHQRCLADGRVLVLVDPAVEPSQSPALDLDRVEVEIIDGGGPRTDPPR